MTGQSWLAPVRAALDAQTAARTEQPVPWFFRDDDAGWAGRMLWPLTGLFATSGVTLDVAAIPAEVGEVTARRLGQLAQDGVIRVYQHGKAHRNHERTGRRCEFGPSRWPAEQLADLASGRELLSARLGGIVEPVFVPPWNRCSDLTRTLLAELGFAGLSRDLPGLRYHEQGLAEIGVCVDWTRVWREGGQERLGRELAAAIGRRTPASPDPDPDPIGVMLHHATLGPDELLALRDLLAVVRDHPAVRLTSLAELVAELAAELADQTLPARQSISAGRTQ